MRDRLEEDNLDLMVSLGLNQTLDHMRDYHPDLYIVLIEMSRSGLPIREDELTETEITLLVDKSLIAKLIRGGYMLTSQAQEIIRKRLGEFDAYFEDIIKTMDMQQIVAFFDFISSGKRVSEEIVEELIEMRLLYRDKNGEVRANILAKNLVNAKYGNRKPRFEA